MPDGKHLFGMVRIGEKGQIVIPKKARDIFDQRDALLLIAQHQQLIARMQVKDVARLLGDDDLPLLPNAHHSK